MLLKLVHLVSPLVIRPTCLKADSQSDSCSAMLKHRAKPLTNVYFRRVWRPLSLQRLYSLFPGQSIRRNVDLNIYMQCTVRRSLGGHEQALNNLKLMDIDPCIHVKDAHFERNKFS